VSHYNHTQTHPKLNKIQPGIEKSVLKEEMQDEQRRMRSVHRTLRSPSFLANIRPKVALLFRKGFKSKRRSEIHMNIKVDPDALNRRRSRFYLRCTCHIYQGL
jgi:hypothetical protein